MDMYTLIYLKKWKPIILFSSINKLNLYQYLKDNIHSTYNKYDDPNTMAHLPEYELERFQIPIDEMNKLFLDNVIINYDKNIKKLKKIHKDHLTDEMKTNLEYPVGYGPEIVAMKVYNKNNKFYISKFADIWIFKINNIDILEINKVMKEIDHQYLLENAD